MTSLAARFGPWALIAVLALFIWGLWGRLEAAQSELQAAESALTQAREAADLRRAEEKRAQTLIAEAQAAREAAAEEARRARRVLDTLRQESADVAVWIDSPLPFELIGVLDAEGVHPDRADRAAQGSDAGVPGAGADDPHERGSLASPP